MTGATSFSHDFYNEILKDGKATEKQQMFMVRLSSIIITIVSIILSLSLQSFNVTFLAVLALTLAASSNLPVILFTIYWKKFNKTGAVFGMLVGLIGTLVLVGLSPNVWSPEPGAALFKGEPIFPLVSPGIVSIPLGFVACYIGTLIGSRKKAVIEDNFSEITVKSNIGNDVKGIAHH
ncbi:sodium:solute symporter family transporter [Neobacillus niacini]|uniref:sodium:solute symporter family transporter n=1 Tax=Neobacillus niacini TaxID=86668 RepID=UPI0027D8ADB0|nr:hypothetical protein [Neobacillus niacini]